MDEDKRDKINELKKKQWLEVWVAIEAVAGKKDVVEESLKNHIAKIERVPNVYVYDKIIREAEKIEDISFLPKDVTEAWSQVVELKFFIKKFSDLINMIYMYGPSAIEILGPDSREIKLDEMQDIANTLAGLMHQCAAAGVGGIVITPK